MNAGADSTARTASPSPLSPVREMWTTITWCVALLLAIVALLSMASFKSRSEGPDPLSLGEWLATLAFGIAIPLAVSLCCALAALILGRFGRPIWIPVGLATAIYVVVAIVAYWPTASWLMLATATDDLPQARWCLRMGVSPDSCNYWTWHRPKARGETALTVAIRRRNIETVKLLVDNGADINLVDGFHLSPLKCAIDTGNRELIDLLTARGAALRLDSKPK